MGTSGKSSSGSSSSVTGYEYYMDFHAGMCTGPVDRVLVFTVGDRQAWPNIEASTYVDATAGGAGIPPSADQAGIQSSTSFEIDAPSLFGGQSSEGGISGNVAVMMGGATESAPSWVQTAMAAILPGFRNAVTWFYSGLICQNNPYPKTWKVRVARALQGWENNAPWYPEKCLIMQTNAGGYPIYAMNPAHIIYECATNKDWGRGFDPSQLDDHYFRYAADTLYNENFGLNLQYNPKEQTLDVFLQSVVDHIGGAIYQDRQTGLLVLKLTRYDYDATTVPHYDYDTGLISVVTDAIRVADTIPGEVIVTAHDQAYDKDFTVRAHNLGVLQTQGGTSTVNTTYAGVSNPTLAYNLAVRDLKLQGSSLRQFTLKMNRKVWGVMPLDVISISCPERSITNMILRVGKIEDGKNDDESITVYAAEDIFGLAFTQFNVNQLTMWSTPNRSAVTVAHQMVLEMPFLSLCSAFGINQAKTLEQDSRMLCVAAKPTDLSVGADICSRAEGETELVKRNSTDFSPTAKLTANVGYYDTEVYFDTNYDMERAAVGTVAVIWQSDNPRIAELVRVDSIDLLNCKIGISRGLADTPPITHAKGDYISLYQNFAKTDLRDYVLGEIGYMAVLTRTTMDVLPLASVQQIMQFQAEQRAYLPYPPAAVAVNGQPFGNLQLQTISPSNDANGNKIMLALTFVGRNRYLIVDQLVPFTDAGGMTLEAGTQYIVHVYNGWSNQSASTQIRFDTSMAATPTSNWVYTYAMWTADGKPTTITVDLGTERDSLECYNAVRMFFTMQDG